MLNVFVPFINTVFPSSKGTNFTLIFTVIILLLFASYKKFLKGILFIIFFLIGYILIINYIKINMLIILFRMTVLFLPCFVLAYLLISEYHSSEILASLEKLKLPKIFVIGLTVTLRYIPTFRKEFQLIKEAMWIRGVKFSIKDPLKTFEYLLVPQLFRCLSLSSELTAAGLTKGINAPNRRTSYFGQGFSILDFLVGITFILGQVLIIGKVI